MPQLGAMAFTREPRPAIEQMFDRAESCEIQRSTAVSSPQMGRFAWIVVLVLTLASPATARGAPAEPGAVFPIEQLVAERWTGDLDEMRRRRVIRVLVTYSKTFYFLDGAQQRGLTYEQLKGFEEFLNARLGTGPLRIHVVFIPVARDELLPGLVAGRGVVFRGAPQDGRPRDRRLGPRRAAAVPPGGPRRARGLRAALEQLPRQSPSRERAAPAAGPASDRHPARRREPRGRGHPRDDARRTRRHHRGGRAQGPVLGNRLPSPAAAPRAGRAHGR